MRLCSCASHTRLPLNKYASLNGVDDAAEARFFLIASQHQAHLAGEGGGQPVPHLWGHWLWLDVAELILCVHQTSETREKGRDWKSHKQRKEKQTDAGTKGLLKYLSFIAGLLSQGIKVKSQCCPSNNITSYVTSKHPRPLETPWCRIQIQLCDIILCSYPVVLTCPGDQEKSLLVSTLWTEYMFLWQRESIHITLIIIVLHGFYTG